MLGSLVAFRKPGGGVVSVWAEEVLELTPAPMRGTFVRLKNGTAIKVDNATRKALSILMDAGWKPPWSR